MSAPRAILHYLPGRACLALLVALCAWPACSTSRFSESGKRLFTDELGRAVNIAPNPQRLISLAPSITETLFALGVGKRIVGVTSYCDFPAEARLKEKVGDTLNPNLERIIALKPDLVIITTASQLENLTRRLDQLQIPVYVINPRTVKGVIASIRHLGEVTGTASRASEIAAEMERRIGHLQQQVQSLQRPRVFYLLQTEPIITAGRNTFINDLINLAGGQSISAEETADYPQFSRETAIARAPEVIIAPASHGSELVSRERLQRDFATTPAVRHHRIIVVNPDLVDRPGPRIVEGLEQLARGLHPEIERHEPKAATK